LYERKIYYHTDFARVLVGRKKKPEETEESMIVPDFLNKQAANWRLFLLINYLLVDRVSTAIFLIWCLPQLF